MWDGLLHRNSFRTKCKSALSRTKTRIELIVNKRHATEKYLRKVISELLKDNRDRTAYDRAEGLHNELSRTSCYDYVEQCCACILANLKQMHKERECPEECKVAVSSLVYAAARFADLPELRDLRNQFNEKYGKSLEPFVNQEKLKPKPPTMEAKLQLIQEIAQEFSITWDSLPLQQQLHTESIDKSTKLESETGASERMSRSRSTVDQVKSKQDRSRLMNDDESDNLRTRRRNSYSAIKDFSEISYEKNSLLGDKIDNPNRKPFTNRTHVTPDECGDDTRSENIASLNKDGNYSYLGYEFRGSKDKKNDDDLFSKAKPRPKSVRTKFLRQSTDSTTSSSEREIEVRESKSARVSIERKYNIFSDEEDDEEVSRKFRTSYERTRPGRTPSIASNMSFPASPDKEDIGTPKSALPPPPGRRRYLFADSQPGSPGPETPSSSGRSRFLPPDSPTEPDISAIRNVKSDSFISDGGNGHGHGHVHPKMPSFDELAERVAALRKM